MNELAYWKDGKKIECRGIYETGREGQVVVFHNAGFGEKPDLEKFPLAYHPQPTIFTILKRKKEGYILIDKSFREIFVPGEHCGNPSCGYLYDANEWAQWAMAHHSEKMGRKDKKVESLEGQLAMLKDILTKQGIRIVTEAQAKQLGLS
ncbi:MAG: hypothetical protein NTX00_04900 [Candidatus Parcubacteria bacterium]|nr:hypothetical protein [Candidatus Parcubacteria bacterium]